MITLFKLGILMLSNLGFWEFFYHKYKFDIHFLPAFTIAVQFSFLFVSGLLNLLFEGSIILYLLGLLFFVYFLFKEKINSLMRYCNAAFCFFVLALALVVIATHNFQIVDADSIHHWSLVTNTMLLTDRYPNFLDTVITFKGYPLGTATYIYYFCRMTSPAEDIQLLSQSFIMLSMILPVFSFIKKNKIISILLIVLMTNYLLCYNNTILDLRVDTVLPLVGAATILFIHYLNTQNTSTSLGYPIWLVAPFLIFLSQIKNSGVFFCLIAAVHLFYTLIQHKENIRATILTCLTPLLSILIWNRHCRYVYENGASAKHSMSADWYSHVISEKTSSDCLSVVKGVGIYTFTRYDLLWIILWLALLYFICLHSEKKHKKYYLNFLIGILTMYFSYMIGVAGMYLFSMPLQESLTMGDISRYTKTIDISIYYFILCYAIHTLSTFDGNKKFPHRNLIFLAIMFITWIGQYGHFANILENPSLTSNIDKRNYYQSVIDEYGVQSGYQYLIFEQTDPYRDSYFYLKYLLNTGEVAYKNVTEETQLMITDNYQYIFVFDYSNPFVDSWVREKHPEQYGEIVIYNF